VASAATPAALVILMRVGERLDMGLLLLVCGWVVDGWCAF